MNLPLPFNPIDLSFEFTDWISLEIGIVPPRSPRKLRLPGARRHAA